jgi:hypothetical protein
VRSRPGRETDTIRAAALDRIDRAERGFKLAFAAGALVELAFLVAFLLLADLGDRTHVLLLLATVALYTLVAIGLVALGAHVTRSTLWVLQAVGERE